MKKLYFVLIVVLLMALCACQEGPALSSSSKEQTSSQRPGWTSGSTPAPTLPTNCDSGHSFSDGAPCCDRCGMEYFTATLEFTLNETKDGYVVAGIGSCERKDIVIPGSYNGLPVTEIGKQAFFYEKRNPDCVPCGEITSVTIPPSVKRIGREAFCGAPNLSAVEFSQGLTEIGEASFSGCNALTELVIPQGVTAIGPNAFGGCFNITRVELPDSLLTMGKAMLSSNRKLKSIRIPDGITEIPDDFAVNCGSLEEVILGKNVVSIGKRAFHSCKSLKSFPFEGIKEIGGQAFEGCKSLEYVKLPQTITPINSRSFYGCWALKKVDLPQTLTSIWHQAFYDCPSLTNIQIPASVEVIYDEAFEKCDALELTEYGGAGYIGNEENPYMVLVRSMDDTLAEVVPHPETRFILSGLISSTKLASLTVSKNVRSIPTDYMCRYYFDSKKGTYPQLIIDPENEYYHMSGNCLIETKTKTLVQAFEGFVIPDDGSVTAIGSMAFAFNLFVKRVIIPDCVTKIGFNAFLSTPIVLLVIGSGVKELGGNILMNTKALSEVYYRGTKEQWQQIAGVFSPASQPSEDKPSEDEINFGMGGNYDLIKKTIYFYSETQPTEEGNYWHYVDGIPTPWESE